MGKLPLEIFKCIVNYTPLISIDLIVENKYGQLLFGKRINEPAKGYYFVPGGRILKDETLTEAFRRITYEELGKSFAIEKAKFIGVYEHFYNNSFVGDEISTHYIVLAYKIKLDKNLELPNYQHENYKWLTKEEIIKDKEIHPYSKAYFGG